MTECLYFAVMGKAEGRAETWHGHVTALTVAPEFRRLGLAGQLMKGLEEISERYLFLRSILPQSSHSSDSNVQPDMTKKNYLKVDHDMQTMPQNSQMRHYKPQHVRLFL